MNTNLEDWRAFFGEIHGVQPTAHHILACISLIGLVLSAAVVLLKSLTVSSRRKVLHDLGVRYSKVARTFKEIERKTFHLTGLLVPLTYTFLDKYANWSQTDFAQLSWTMTVIVWTGDSLRVLVPSVNSYFPYTMLNTVIRDKEKTQLSGTCYFGLGCAITVTLFPRAVAVMAIVFLVAGDMSAALFGVSFGGDLVVVKMGRLGKKSLEGSAAMFSCCVLLGLLLMDEVFMAEYAVVLGALAATVVELWEPFGINDNLTIPFVSG